MVIKGHSDLIADRLAHSEPLRKNALEIDKAADRAAGLIRQLLTFSRMQALQPKVLDLNAFVADISKMLGHLYTFAEVLDMKPSDFLPPAGLAESPASWALLPIPDDLKPQQKEQIARLIGPSHQTTSKPKEGNNGKSAKTNRRSPR